MQLIDSSFLLLLIFLFLMFGGEGSGDMLETEEGTVRVIFYNVFEGMGGKDDGRVATLKSYISGFDVVGFSELNGWDPTSFREYFADVFPYSTFLTTETGYHLGALSKQPIHEKVLHAAEPMHHGLIGFASFGMTFFVTHLNPHSTVKRASESQFIVDTLADILKPTPAPKGTAAEGAIAIVMGDLNTLSPGESYDLPSLKALYQNRRTRRKFFKRREAGHGGGTDSNIGDQIDYQPFAVLADVGGYKDLSAPGLADAFTVPTPVNTDFMHATALKLDYILGNDGAQAAVLEGTVPLKDDVTSGLSDHYPVKLVLRYARLVERDEL
jgi:endonuclease/exonuclease/phosphatase family metal-dependent hydrolase